MTRRFCDSIALAVKEHLFYFGQFLVQYLFSQLCIFSTSHFICRSPFKIKPTTSFNSKIRTGEFFFLHRIKAAVIKILSFATLGIRRLVSRIFHIMYVTSSSFGKRLARLYREVLLPVARVFYKRPAFFIFIQFRNTGEILCGNGKGNPHDKKNRQDLFFYGFNILERYSS